MAQCGKLPDITEYTDKYIKHAEKPHASDPSPPCQQPSDSHAPVDFWPKTYEEALKILEPTRAKAPKWPKETEYIDEYIHPSKMTPHSDPWNNTTERKIDMLTGRPRTPNDQYTVLTNLQLKNMKQDSSPFFMLEDPEGGPGCRKGPIVRPAPIDRYATNTSQFLFRDTPRSHPHCWIDDQWQREPPADHNTSRLGASLRWGPQKTGARTISHFHKEDVHRYLNIDEYKRNPTNIPSMVVMKHGRPSDGYYQQRNPNFNTWFGSSHRLNETNILTTIKPKTYAEYEQGKNMEQDYYKQKAAKWPEISEYTEKFLLRSKPPVKIDTMEARKQFHRELRRQEAAERLQSQTVTAGQQATAAQPVPA